MKKFQGMNFYEILEVSPSASDFEIRQAYKEAISLYDEDSLTTYSLFTDEEREEILGKIDEAFSTLIDGKSRAEYDRELVASGKIEPSLLTHAEKRKPIPLFQPRNSFDQNALSRRLKEKTKDKDVEEIAGEILSMERISGDDLRKLRDFMGITLEEIFQVSRIGISTLKAIEANDFENLPTRVYLKNFLKTYAGFLKVDPVRVVEGYMKNLPPDSK